MPRALIVDDKAENLYFLAALLSGNGYAVDQARNGVEALAAAKDHRPDLIISDILMPKMDGFALCRQWRQDPHLQAIPFVFYTATYTDPKDEALALSLGADGFLIKPLEPEAFMAQITEVLQRQQAGQLRQPPADMLPEASYLREYNAALIHKLEDKLAELEHTSRVKNALLGSVSHELRTPLTPVTILVELLLRDPGTPPYIREDLETIRRNVELEKHFIGDLLDYAALQSGSFGLHRQSLTLHTLVQRVAALWREQFQAKALHLELHLDAAADQILGDADRLEQVLWNLLHHTVARSPAGGVVAFGTRNQEPETLVLEVRDDGPPMEAQAITWAFSPFDALIRMGEYNRPDVGVGLAVTKGIVEAHGGSIQIAALPHARGQTVIVRLPVHRTPSAAG